MAFSIQPKECENCPAQKRGSKGFRKWEGPRESQLILIGSGPSEHQSWNNSSLVSDRMDRWLSQAGIPKREILVGNLVQCWLPLRGQEGLREPERKEIEFCWRVHGRGTMELATDNTTSSRQTRQVLVPVGLTASKFFLNLSPTSGVEKYIGTISERELPDA